MTHCELYINQPHFRSHDPLQPISLKTGPWESSSLLPEMGECRILCLQGSLALRCWSRRLCRPSCTWQPSRRTRTPLSPARDLTTPGGTLRRLPRSSWLDTRWQHFAPCKLRMKIRETRCISDVFTTVLQSLVCMSHDYIDASFRCVTCNSHRVDTSLRPVASNTVTVTRLTPVSDLWHLTVTWLMPASSLWHLTVTWLTPVSDLWHLTL